MLGKSRHPLSPATHVRSRKLLVRNQHPNINFSLGYPSLIGFLKEGIFPYPNLMVFVWVLFCVPT